MINRLTALLAVMFAAFAYAPAEAYVGPGAGISLIGSTIGLLVAIVMAFGIVIIWPLKKLFRRRAQVHAAADGSGEVNDPDAD